MSDFTLIRTDEYEIRGEFLWFGVVLHTDVFVPWGKGVRKRFRDHVLLIAECLSQPVYAFQTPSHDPKKRKFIKDVGGVFDHYRYTDLGERAEMYLRRPLDLSKGMKHGWTIQKQNDHDQRTLQTRAVETPTAVPYGGL